MDPSFSNKQQFSFLTCGRNCPLSNWKPILLKLNILYFTDIVSHVSLWKPLRPWPEILCTPKRIMWTCLPVEKGKALFMKTGWHCSAAAILYQLGFSVTDANRISFCCLDEPTSLCWTWQDSWLRGSHCRVFLSHRGLWMMKPLPHLCWRVVSLRIRPLWWRLSAWHAGFCPWLINPPYTHVHSLTPPTHIEITPGSPMTSCLLVSDTHFPPLSCS